MIAPLIAIYYIVTIINELRLRRKFILSSGIWMAFWIVITLLSIAPYPVSRKIANFFGFESNVNAALFLVSGFLVVISFYLSSRVVTLERQVTQLVRKIALERKKDEDHERSEEK